MFKWYKATLLEDRKVERKNGAVILKDAEGQEVKRWNFFRAFPCRWRGPQLEANRRGEYAVERIEIAHEGLEVDNDDMSFDFRVGMDMNAVQDLVSEMSNNLTEPFVPVLNGSRDQFIFNMKSLVGENYVWGGNSLEDGGMDCSGSIIYGLNQMGNNISDQTASDFYDNYTIAVEGEIQSGDLRFLRDSNGTIIHVQVIVNTNGDRINASGGPENTIENPGIIELLKGPLPASGEIRRLRFGE